MKEPAKSKIISGPKNVSGRLVYRFRIIYTYVKKITARIKEDNITAYSAHAAFFLFISAFPFMILLMTLIKYTPLTKDLLYTILTNGTPGIISDTVNSWLDEIYSDSFGILSASVLGALWASSKGFVGIADGINRIYHHRFSLNYIVYRLLGILYSVIFLILTMGAMLLVLFGGKLNKWLFDTFNISSDILKSITDLRIYIVIIVFITVILAIYILLPNRRVKLIHELPGTLFTTVGWIAFSTGYSFYVDIVSHNKSIYGSLSTIIFFMLWLYFCIYILFLGAELNFNLQTWCSMKKNTAHEADTADTVHPE